MPKRPQRGFDVKDMSIYELERYIEELEAYCSELEEKRGATNGNEN